MFDASLHAITKMIRDTEGRRELRSMFFKRGNSMEYVKAGSSFRRTHRDNMVETAEVLSVAADSFGIPHVRFRLTFMRPDRNVFTEGPRVLSLETFAERYTERCAA